MPNDRRDAILASINFERYFAEHGLRYESGSGDERRARCPFHDDRNPSFSVNVSTGKWRCFSPACGSQGDLFAYHQKRYRVDFITALRELESFCGILPQQKQEAPNDGVIDEAIVEAAHNKLVHSPELLQYLHQHRGLTIETIKKFQIGHGDDGRYYIPIRDELGTLRNIRRYKPNADAGEKMISWRKGFGALRLFPIMRIFEAPPDEPLILCAGEWDCILADQLGFHSITATGGEGSWRNEWSNLLFNRRDVVICYDNDEPDEKGKRAGEEGAKRVAKMLVNSARSVRIATLQLDHGKDITDAVVKCGWTAQDFINRAFSTAERIYKTEAEAETAQQQEAVAKAIDTPQPPAPKPDEPDVVDFGNASYTDVAHAKRFVRLHGEHIRYVSRWGSWLVWDGQHWERDDHGVRVQEKAKDIGRSLLKQAATEHNDDTLRAKLAVEGNKALMAPRIRAAVDLSRGMVLVDHEALDTDPWLLGVRNGVIDLRTSSLRNADPADLMTMQAPTFYREDATCPRWLQAMQEWFPDEQVRLYVQRLVGAALVGAQHDHVFVIHYGGGRNGKGTFMRALFNMLGPYAVVPHLNLLVQTRHTEHDTIKAALFRARLAVASETERRVKLAEASVKNLTGRDRITCRRMRENPWEFTPSHSLWLQTNYLPEISGRDEGIWRRIRVVPWVATFQPTSSGDLDEVLASEASGILLWAIDGCRMWQNEGLHEPEAVKRATMQYRNAEDRMARFALDTGLRFDAMRTVTSERLNAAYQEWTASEGIKPNQRELTDWMKESGATIRQRAGTGARRERYWQGAGFIETSENGAGDDDAQLEAYSQSLRNGRAAPVSADLPENPDF